jgi:hypothetical protein
LPLSGIEEMFPVLGFNDATISGITSDEFDRRGPGQRAEFPNHVCLVAVPAFYGY